MVARNGRGMPNIDKLNSYVLSLLETVQLLRDERNSLYENLVNAAQEGRISNKVLTRRTGIEQKLSQLYQTLSDVGPFDASAAHDEGAVMKKWNVVLFALLFWILGIVTVYVVGEYIYAVEFLYRSPNRSIY